MAVYKNHLIGFRRALELASESLESKRPFSLIRIGDGGNCVLAYPENVSAEHYEWVIRRA